MGLVHELRLMQCYLMPDETALRELSEQVIEKLKLLTDAVPAWKQIFHRGF